MAKAWGIAFIAYSTSSNAPPDDVRKRAVVRAIDLRLVKGTTLPKGRVVGADERFALFACCDADPSPAGPRDAALLTLGYTLGSRRSELVKLDLSDLDLDAQTVTIRQAKGAMDRSGYLTDDACARVRSWLLVRGSDSEPLFRPIIKSGRILARRLTDQSVLLILRRRAHEA